MADEPNANDDGDKVKDQKPAGGGGSEDEQAKIAAAVERETAGLRSKRDELLADKVSLKKRLDETQEIFTKLGGEEGVERLQVMYESLQKDELGKLLSEGKHDEWHEKKTAALRGDLEGQIAARDKTIEELTTRCDSAEQRYRDKVLDVAVRASCSKLKVFDTAIEDVIGRANTVFHHHPDHGLVILEGEGDKATIVYGKDGTTPKTVEEWLAEQKTVARHWFPASQGADASGNIGGSVGDGVDLDNVSTMAQYRKAREKLKLGSGVGTNDIP